MKDFLYRSERIKEFRLKKTLTQVEFAKKVGISKGYIALIEAGKRKVNFKFLDKLQIAFDMPEVEVAELIYGELPIQNIGSLLEGPMEESKTKELPPQIDVANLVGVVEAGLETEDFLSFPIQTFDSTIQAGGQFLGQVVIHKRVFGRRKNLAAVQLNGGKEVKVVIVGK